MSLHLKVMEGTRPDPGHSLCETCQFGLVIRGSAIGQEMRQCGHNYYKPLIPPFTVVQCNGYYRKGTPSIRDLYETAWILETKKIGRQIGFTPYKEWKKEHGDAPEPL